MKQILYILAVLFAFTLYSCGGSGYPEYDKAKNAENAVNNFFKEYQTNHPDWYLTEKGQKDLKEAFRNEMTTNVEFAKTCASVTYSRYGIDSRITDSDPIANYSKDNGEYGEIKAFEFVVPIGLVRPMNNGDTTIMFQYEIITPIPADKENHDIPYVDNANMCDTLSDYFKTEHIYVHPYMELGTYIIATKDLTSNN